MIEISAAAKASLEVELASIEKEIERLEEDVETARGFGDFSENSELDAARDALNMKLARKKEIEAILSNHRIKQTYSTTSIASGTLISVKVRQGDGEWEDLGLLMFDEIGTMELDGKVTPDGPLGAAIRGMGNGEYTVLDVKGNPVQYQVTIEPESRISEFMEKYSSDRDITFSKLFGDL